MFASQFDSGFVSSQSTQASDSGFSKNRISQPVLPLTVKQISEAYNSTDDKSNLVVDGVEAANVKLLGLVCNKEEKVTNVTFILDDGTGRIDVIRWVNDTLESNETAAIQNGTYVTVIGSLKEFQGKRQFGAFSIRPVIDYNDIHHHFIHCIQIHLVNTKKKARSSPHLPTSPANAASTLGVVKTEQSAVSNQFSASRSNGESESDIYKLVLDVFQEPASQSCDHGLHVDEVVRQLGLPANKIKEAIDYHVDVGHIYSTIDDYHFKST